MTIVKYLFLLSRTDDDGNQKSQTFQQKMARESKNQPKMDMDTTMEIVQNQILTLLTIGEGT